MPAFLFVEMVSENWNQIYPWVFEAKGVIVRDMELKKSVSFA